MTMQVSTKLVDLANKFTGQKCWLVGSGPSLDILNPSRLGRANIFALNAAITLFANVGRHKNAYWLFRDRRVIREVAPRLKSWRRWRVITHLTAYHSLRDSAGFKRINSMAYTFNKDAFIHKRTVVEDALQILVILGFSEVYLLGIDHRIINNKPYAEALKWKECFFYNPKKPPPSGKSIALQSMVEAMKDIKPHLGKMKVFNTSPYYPEPVFEHVGFEEALGRHEKV
jgi:hypothetical protein